jgi:hypothetical protein
VKFERNRIYDSTNFSYLLQQTDFDKCRKFSNALPWDPKARSFGKYRDEVEFRHGHYVSKLSEVACYNLLKGNLAKVTPPDFSIYDINKSATHEPDITVGATPVSIKLCQFNVLSWTFNVSDVYHSPKKIVICCDFNIRNRTISIRAILNHKFIIDNNLLKPLITGEYNKQAVYWADLEGLLGGKAA